MTSVTVPRGERVRVVLTGVSLAIPVLGILVSWLLWSPGLPERVAFHWNASGRADATMPSEPLFVMALVGASLGLAIGAILLLLPRIDPSGTRSSLFWVGSLAGLSAGIWIVPAGLTYQAGSAAESELGGWIVVLAAAVFYGGVPYLLMPKVSRGSTGATNST